MTDPLLPYIDWVGPLLQEPFPDEFAPGTEAHEILSALREGWGTMDTALLLASLTSSFGERARDVVGRFLEVYQRRDWAEVGEREAHPGSEIDDFIRVLWGPLPDMGFEFTSTGEPTDRQFSVTRCPVAEAARVTGMQGWMYTLACATDFYTTPAFCPRIEFNRTRTLVEGGADCDHHYLLRAEA